MPKRNWWRRLCHDFLSRSRRATRPVRINPRFELLENRLAPAVDLSSVAAQISNPTPVAGEWVTVRVTYNTEGITTGGSEGESYVVRFDLNGTIYDFVTNLGIDQAGVVNQTFNLTPGFWSVRAGSNSLTVTLDPFNDLLETDDTGNNSNTLTFTPTAPTLTEKFIMPTALEQSAQLGVVNYMDTMPGNSTFARDYRGLGFVANDADGIDIFGSNFTQMDAGVPIYAAAGGTVTSLADAGFDRRTSGSGANNSITIDHGGGWTTIYNNLLADSSAVEVGDIVTQGQLIALMGSSGTSTGLHTRFQVRNGSTIVDPFQDIANYFADPLPIYQGDLSPYVKDSGISNYNGDHAERTSSKTIFSTAETDNVVFWNRFAHLNAGDQLSIRWFRPDGTLHTQTTDSIGALDRNGVRVYTLSTANWSVFQGTWEVAVSLAGKELSRQSFQVVAASGAVPEILLHDGGGNLIPSGRTTPIDFGSISQGSGGPTQTFSIQNHSGAALDITGIVLPPGFSLVSGVPVTVAANSSQPFTVRLDTAVVGAKFGAIQLFTNDADEGAYSFNVKGTVTGAVDANAPVVNLPGPALVYQVGATAEAINPLATITDADTVNFSGGQIIIEFAAGGQPGDRLTILDSPTGPGPGLISLNGSDVEYEGIVVGTFTPGTGATPLTIDLSGNVTLAAVQAILRAAAYSNVDFLSTTPRYVRFTVIDETAKTSNLAIQVILTDLKAVLPGVITGVPFSGEQVVSSLATSVRSVVAGDVNGDGDVDFVTASSGSNHIHWYDKSGAVYTRRTITTATTLAVGARSVFLADLDGDGDLDVISGSYNDDRIVWYENSGGALPTWTAADISTTADGATSVFAADVDGDGDMDVLSASYLDDKIAWYENDGAVDPVFTLITISTAANGARSVVAADLDRDGDMDIASASYLDNKIAWYQSNGAADPSFTARLVSSVADGATAVAVGDIDGDGDKDLISASANDDKIAWYRNSGTANPSFVLQTVSLAADGAQSVTAADIDGDGDTDIAAASRSDDTVRWFENNGQQNFTERVIWAAADGASSVTTADIDRDGDIDVIASSATDNTIAYFRNDTIHRSALVNTTAGVNSGADGVFFVTTADVDRDGDPDILSASLHDDKIAWYRNDGNGSYSPRIVSTTANGATSVAAADMDGDGDIDLLSASFYDNKIAWYRNDGAQNFTLVTITAISAEAAGAISVVAADVDGDGDMDVVAGSFEDDEIAWYENDGLANPTFTRHTITTVADGVRMVAVADIDRDGDMDIASASYNSSRIDWYQNDGTQNFSRRNITMGAAGAMSVALFDMDRDGDIDALSTSEADDGVTWYRNNGGTSPTFSEINISTAGDKPRSAVGADMDGDGDMDVVAVSLDDNTVRWFDNNGSQVFTLRTIATTSLGAISVAAADLDGDGDTDVASAAYFGDAIAWHENKGGQFALATTSTAPVGISQGQSDDVLRIVMTHKGRTGDSDEELTSLDLRFADGNGVSMTSIPANALIENLFIYRDANGNGTFQSGTDTLVTTVSDLDLLFGVHKVSFTDGDINVRVQFGTTATFFVVIELTADAVSQSPSEFRITHVTESTSTADDRNADLPLRLEFVADFVGTVVDALEAPLITNLVTDIFFTVDQFGTFEVTSTGGPPPDLFLTGDALPNGVTFVDNGDGTATIEGTPTGLVAGVYNLIITADNGVNPDAVQNFTLTVDPGALAQVSFVQQPTNETAGATITPFVTVQLEDQYGNDISQLGVDIDLALILGTGPLNGDLSKQTDANGLATFDDLSLDFIGTKQLQATSPGLTSENSSTFVISAAAATQLEFVSQPTDETAGVVISPAVTVQLRDQFGNLASQSGVSITVSLNGTGTLGGTVTQLTNASGVATFNNLTVNLVGTKSLTATSGSLTADTSDNFIISAAAASTLAFVNQPTNTTAGNNIASVTVQVQDAFGNNISQSTSVTVSLNTGTGPLQGTFTQLTNGSGLATFNDLRIDVTGAKTLQAASAGLASTVSASFNINAAAATNLVYIQQPIDTAAGSTIPNITVQIRDAFGNNVSQVSGIGIALISGSGTLSGTTTQSSNAGGLATFSGLSINLAGLKTLQVSSTGLGTTNSNPFTINAGAATEVVFVQQPTDAVAGVNIAPAVSVRLRDQFGNLVSQSGVTVNMSATGLLGDTSEDTDASGIATFSDLRFNIVGTKSLLASSSGLTSATSNNFVISAAAAAQLGFGQQPTDTTAGVVISPAVTVQVQDQFGNAVSQLGTSVSLILGGTGTLLGTTSQLTNGSGLATFNDLQINIAGLKSLQAGSGSLTGAQSVDFNITAAAASKVVFVQQPTDTDIFVAISPAVTVRLRDQFDNDVSQSGTSIDMVLLGGGTLGGTTTQTTNASGLATFSNLTVDAGGTKNLRADSGSLTSATSSPFFINIPPTQVDFVSQPTDTTAGNIIAPVTVQLKDHVNNAVLQAGVSITVSLFSGSGTLLGTLTRQTDGNGLATFDDLQINAAGTGKVLRATSGILTADDSSSFTINAAAATEVVFVQQPTNATAGVVIAPDVTVQLRDQFGNNVTSNGVNVTMSLQTGAGPLMGTTTRATVVGVATFDDLMFQAAGAKTLRASAGLTDAISSSFTISAAAATQLAFVQQPTNTSTGTTIAPPVTVQLRDQFGNDALGSANVTVALNSGSGTLLGTLTQATSGSGLATFNDLSIAATGGKTLSASSSPLTGAISNSFNISAPATNVVFVQQPTDTVAGNAIAPAVTVQLKDSFGTDVTQASISVTIALVNGSGTLLGTTTQLTDVNGLATFSNLQINTAGSGKNLQASSAGLTSTPASNSFSITAAAASKVAFVQQPTNTVAGANITPAVTVQLRDAFDNNVSQAGVNVTVSQFSGTGTLLGTLTQATNGAGVATFNDLQFNVTGLKSLQATSGALTAGTSTNFTISAAAATQIVFIQQPSDAIAGQFITPPVAVQLLDQFGNNVSQAGRTVTLSMLGAGVLSGTTSQLTSASGVATFGNLSVNLVGAKSLQAASAGLTGAASTGFNINAVADRVEFAQQPAGATAGVVMAPVTVQLKDQFGNLINQANVAVTLSLIAGNGTLLGTLTQLTNAAGLATFADLSMQTAGVKTLRASSAGLLFAHSANFQVSAAAAKKLGFTRQPVSVRAGVKMPAVVVQLFDEFGNGVAQAGVTVNLQLISGGQKKLYSAKTNAAGQAVFTNLVPMRRGPGRIVASSAGLLTANSNPFQVLVNPNFPWL